MRRFKVLQILIFLFVYISAPDFASSQNFGTEFSSKQYLSAPNLFEGLSSPQDDEFSAGLLAYYQALAKASTYFGIESKFKQSNRQQHLFSIRGDDFRESFHSETETRSHFQWLFGREIHNEVRHTNNGYVGRCIYELDTLKTMAFLARLYDTQLRSWKQNSLEISQRPSRLSSWFRRELLNDSLTELSILLNSSHWPNQAENWSKLPRLEPLKRHIQWVDNEAGTVDLVLECSWPFDDPLLVSVLWPIDFINESGERQHYELRMGMHHLGIEKRNSSRNDNQNSTQKIKSICFSSQLAGKIPELCYSRSPQPNKASLRAGLLK